MTLLEVRDLAVSYGDSQVIWSLDMHLAEGEIVALVGANGAGKTTLLRALTGLVPSHGRIALDGNPIGQQPPHRRARAGIAMVPEGRRLFAGLTVRQNLDLGSRSRSRSRPGTAGTGTAGIGTGGIGNSGTGTGGIGDDIDFIFTQFPELARLQHRIAGLLSGGEQQMCAIGRALMARPRILLVDEMSLGLAPVVVERLATVLRTVNQARNIAILLVEQDVGLALEIAHRAYVLETGRIVIKGPSAGLLHRDDIRTAYLGFH